MIFSTPPTHDPQCPTLVEFRLLWIYHGHCSIMTRSGEASSVWYRFSSRLAPVARLGPSSEVSVDCPTFSVLPSLLISCCITEMFLSIILIPSRNIWHHLSITCFCEMYTVLNLITVTVSSFITVRFLARNLYSGHHCDVPGPAKSTVRNAKPAGIAWNAANCDHRGRTTGDRRVSKCVYTTQ